MVPNSTMNLIIKFINVYFSMSAFQTQLIDLAKEDDSISSLAVFSSHKQTQINSMHYYLEE